MNRDKLASIITRMHFCNDSKLENIDEWIKMKKYLLSLDEYKFSEKLKEFGLQNREAS